VIDLDAVAAHDFGDRVFHAKFGYGTVTGVEGDKLTVDFDKAGEKRVVAGYVAPASAAGDVPF
jgi:DNA helicase-2/ATP-dependent DNA helicase PcrA